MGIDNAVIASDFILCDTIIGMHYDTFDIIKINHEDAKRQFETAGRELMLMKIGSSVDIKN
jgi:L-ascorbate metabolism protein UlaG (beta-lactamase superfamily)